MVEVKHNHTLKKKKKTLKGICNILIIVELAELSPIIIQNSSNPSSRKNLDVRLYDRTRYYF